MTAVYAVALAIGVVGLLALVVAGDRLAAQTVAARRAVTATMAFGLAGMSATFAGLAPFVAAGLAVVAAVVFVAYSERADADHQ